MPAAAGQGGAGEAATGSHEAQHKASPGDDANIWYSAKYTYTACVDGALPPGAANIASYGRRGWCVFERLRSSLVKHCNGVVQYQRG